MSNLKSYVIHTIGGGWGKETIEENLIKVSVIRGTDFPKLEKLDFSSVPIRFETLKKIESRTLQVGDLIIEVSGGSASSGQRTGRCLYITQEILDNLGKYVIPASFCRLLRLDKEKINSKFIYYQIAEMHLSDQIGIYENQSTGISNFQFNLFLDEIFPKITDLNKQNSIVDIFNSIDQKIQVNTKINQTLEQIAQALFKSWFVDFDPVHAKAQALSDGMSLEQAELAAMQVISGKTPEELTALSQTQPERYAELAETAKAFPCEMVEVDGVEVPKGWELSTIGDCYDVVMGQSPKGETYNENKQGMLFYQGRAEFGWRFPTPRLFTTDPKRIAEQNSILMSVRAPVGDINIALEKCCIGRGLAALQHKSKSLSFGLYQIQSIKPELDLFNGEGTVFGSINQANLKNIQIINPEEKFIQLFEKNLSSCDSKIMNNEIENNALKEIRDLLLPRLLSGKIEND